MAIDGAISRPDGEALGTLVLVQEAIAASFPGIEFARESSGAEKIKEMAKQGVVFPDVIRQHMESTPAELSGDYQGKDFSAQFYFGSSDIVKQVHVVLRGNTVASGPMFAPLQRQYGWIMTHH